MAVAGPLDEAGVRSSVNGQILAFTDDYPTHRCTVVIWRFLNLVRGLQLRAESQIYKEKTSWERSERCAQERGAGEIF